MISSLGGKAMGTFIWYLTTSTIYSNDSKVTDQSLVSVASVHSIRLAIFVIVSGPTGYSRKASVLMLSS